MTQQAPPLTSIRTRWSSPSTDDQFVVENPATGQTVTVVQGAGPEEVDQAVRAAHAAHLHWKRRPARERGRHLRRIAEVIRANADEIAGLESLEMGKPVSQARNFDVEAAISIFEYFASMVEVLPSQARDYGPVVDMTMLEPYGVIAGIVPFNWPPIHTAGKVAPALAVGNAVVLKPPEQAPSVVLRMVELMQSVLPDRVVHAVAGRGQVGAALAGHRLVGKVSFTGSPRTGASVLRTAAGNLTPTLMELGGKNPLLVFDDADLHAALLAAVDGGFFNQGEACTAASRILVQENIYAEFEEKLCAAVSRLKVGDGFDANTDVGPLVTRDQQRRVLDYLQIAVDEGARIAAQAPLPGDPRLADGFYVAPTVLADVSPRMRVAREEIFGPVVSLIPFKDEEEAVRIANGTPFGLVASVFTADGDRALRVSRQIRAGGVFVNNYQRIAIGTGFGGVGHSGFGREHAQETLAEYGYTKTIRLAANRDELSYWSAAARVLDA
ncbi:aldehyde dehydrogenase family protein [Mycobacterium parmense]|uniref:Putative succinate-semialdehyde dehydrogenase [NADP(+)] 2 n=1 Tax=Mycobacterium parmense TaxID=185642 RepID=A0A7I7YYR1_9MYCO|nr:aldehyde dehydrogenase family protein [Mycobacterium parmense]MCV7350432.1 aldehyde dehydrogenase [Mycobacterium parmense]ORW48166.1 aldehyde dehydrogenase [Mycobacterium parmense]BBZ46144.1 aldehyde dehydrogenase [Mycobacterium parmense]